MTTPSEEVSKGEQYCQGSSSFLRWGWDGKTLPSPKPLRPPTASCEWGSLSPAGVLYLYFKYGRRDPRCLYQRAKSDLPAHTYLPTYRPLTAGSRSLDVNLSSLSLCLFAGPFSGRDLALYGASGWTGLDWTGLDHGILHAGFENPSRVYRYLASVEYWMESQQQLQSYISRATDVLYILCIYSAIEHSHQMV